MASGHTCSALRGGARRRRAHEFFKLYGWPMQHIPLRCNSYTGIGENSGCVEFFHGDIVFGMMRKGDKVLVVDDVFDTGKTAEAVKAKLDAVGVDSRIACVYWKPPKNLTSLKPDYYVKTSLRLAGVPQRSKDSRGRGVRQGSVSGGVDVEGLLMSAGYALGSQVGFSNLINTRLWKRKF